MELYINEDIKSEPSVSDLYATYATRGSRSFKWADVGKGLVVAVMLNTSIVYQTQASNLNNQFLTKDSNIELASAYNHYSQNGDMVSFADIPNLKVSLSPSFKFSRIYQDKLKKEYDAYKEYRRELSLMRSFHENCIETVPVSNISDFQSFLRKLVAIKFVDDVVQYDKYDECINVSLYLPNELEVSIGKYIDEVSVPFTIYYKKELLVSDAMDLDKLLAKIARIQKKLQING